LGDRGFSFRKESDNLDMRIDKEKSITAQILLNILPEEKLREIFSIAFDFGPAKRISKTITEKRVEKKIETVGDLNNLLKAVNPALTSDFLAKVYMCLRIVVNSELETLKEALPKIFKVLKSKGKLEIITFHSGEDEIVKHYFKSLITKGFAKAVNKKPLTAKEDELKTNPASRSAKLRVIEKT